MTSTTAPSRPAWPGSRAVMLMIILGAVGGAYWSTFVWFHMDKQWETAPSHMLFINSGFGLCILFGSLLTARASRRFTPRSMMLAGYAALILITIAATGAGSAALLGFLILAHALAISFTWPNLEFLMVRGKHGRRLGRAVGAYNLSWSSTSAVIFAFAGALYKIEPMTLFLLPAAAWGAAMALIVRHVPNAPIRTGVPHTDDEADPADAEAADVAPWIVNALRSMGRLGNMAGYVLSSTLIPIMPAITQRLGLDLAQSTLFASVLGFSRMAGFAIFASWGGWHFRVPLFLASLLSLPVFLGVFVFSQSVVVGVAAQVVLGLSIGLLYSSSLFYSMHGGGETDQAAYHEAIIGAGIFLGPLISAAAGSLGRARGVSELDSITVCVIALLFVLTLIAARRLLRPAPPVAATA